MWLSRNILVCKAVPSNRRLQSLANRAREPVSSRSSGFCFRSAALEGCHDAACLRVVRRIQHDAIDLHHACSACVEREEYAFSPTARRGWALAFLDGVRPISTLHGVVFAILGPAQRSTPFRDTAPSMLRAAAKRYNFKPSCSRGREIEPRSSRNGRVVA